MHGTAEAPQAGSWTPNIAWIAFAVFVAVSAIGLNLSEMILGYVFHDPRAILVPNLAVRILDDLGRALMCVVGLVLLLRYRGRRSTFLLAIGLLALAGFPLQMPFPNLLFLLLVGPVAYILPFFAIARLRESGILLRRGVWWLLAAALAVRIIVFALEDFPAGLSVRAIERIDLIPAGFDAVWNSLVKISSVTMFVLTAALLAYGRYRAAHEEGHRLLLLFFAVTVILLGNLTFTLFNTPTAIFPDAVTVTASTFRIVGSLLFAYAILKHRVIDVGFAVNRTLVYGAVTFTILAAFGLVEYAAKSFIPHAWPEAGTIITAGIAVLLFLSFHHLHHWFEHHIERLFFHHWHRAEGELKRFVGSAVQFSDPQALCTALADELRRFAQGAEVAVFLRRDDGDYCRAAGQMATANECYDDGDRAFALMRAEREPVELVRSHSALPGELAVPMLDQHGLAGQVLMGVKPDGSRYRPDEIEIVGWAVHQVGLDLQALRAKALDSQLATLTQRLAAAEAERDRLLTALGKGSAARNAAAGG